ncbi:MAG: hypothetical protein KGY41_06395 [Desulfovermiculus sp.]|nr:hypothetical protein [Desulfovermiculus sp.]
MYPYPLQGTSAKTDFATVILFSGGSRQECSGFSVQCSASEGLIHEDMILWKHIWGHFEASGTQIKEYQDISISYAEH